ncbi:helix-turn-helix domain-containing protein [Mycolicibacter minnesotensis]|uniref:helix-turn-helix domain-containing protein n=1 Tax=Mycolicibacter minnesotensis TaxID=1118379 RepID=UPI00138B5D9E|nr:helix-turn-helix domain-containing protein [Mycolicibacter minnesotensis]BBY31943.1 hypothetical protein MMIN_00040 [Mycolicibacter minnesotensis]
MSTQPEPKRRMSSQERREQLLDHARDIVAAEGFAAVTIDRVARAAQVTRTVVYQNFGDLAGLMSALLDRESGIAFAGMRSVEGPPADDPDALGGHSGLLARGAHQLADHLEPASRSSIATPDPHGTGPSLCTDHHARRLSRLAARPIDADGVTMRLLLSAVEELALLHLTDPRAHPDELVLSYLRSLVGWALRVETASAVTGR